jgi:DNA polymerase-4
MKRVIFLVDMNSFYISCERTRHPEIDGKPAAVAGDPINRTGIILTSNYEARKYGIKTTMVVREAMRLCPSLIIISPDHEFYEQKSKEVMKILSSYTPVIEQNSIDEAWLDMTGCEGIFGSPLESANNIMERIKNELDLWCSIGISENKFLSKMASDMKKPLGITELWKNNIEQKMWPLPVNYMYGVGKQTAQKFQNKGIATIKDLALADNKYIFANFGKSGTDFHLLANGIDTSIVTPTSKSGIKSIGRSVTLPHDTLDIEYLQSVLFDLSDEVGMTARKYGKKGHTVQISIKYSDFKSITRQMTLPATFLVKDIYISGVELLRKNWNNKPVRLIGISLNGFDNSNKSEQMSLFELPNAIKEKSNEDKIESIENVIHNIRQKYGSSIIKPGMHIKK